MSRKVEKRTFEHVLLAKIQIRILSVWSESWRAKDAKFLYTDNEDPVRIVQKRLRWARMPEDTVSLVTAQMFMIHKV